MITLRVGFAMIGIGLVFAGGRVWPTVATPSKARHTLAVSTTVPGLADATPAAEPHLDVYGNEIDDAVGDYRIDLLGDVYERHSPEIEVSRLGPPVS